jgi:hypothetical protein
LLSFKHNLQTMAAAATAIANHLAQGYSAYNQESHTPTTGHTSDEEPDIVDSAPANLSAAGSFVSPDVDLFMSFANPDPADVSESFFAKYDRAYFRRLSISPRNIRVAYAGKDGRLDVAIGPGQTQYELLVRTPTLTCKWKPHIWPLGDNKVDNPVSMFGAEAHELYKSRYKLEVAPHATDSASTDPHGRNLHAVHFFNWCYTLTREVHAYICKNLPQVVTFAGSKIRDSYNTVALQRREPCKSQEEAEAMFRDNGFTSPFKSVLDKSTGTYRENSEYMAFGGNVFQKISEKMKSRCDSLVPSTLPALDPNSPYPPSLYIHSLFNQRKDIDKTPGPQFGKLKEGFIFKDVPLVLLRGPNNKPHLVPYEQRKGLLTDRSVVSCLVGISFSISSKTGLLSMNTSLKRVTYCGENNQLAGDGVTLDDELAWDTRSLGGFTIPAGFMFDSQPVVTDVTEQLQITDAAKKRGKEAGGVDEHDDSGASDTERRQRRRVDAEKESIVH